ncbi:EamA family transporter [Pseudorhodoplanes sinuspersici]|uniref:Uncharacterized protein n=1 Tax=Pseudorhodoplanes sinuspersici TaxID=1235591 RepID=A0A1W6ZS49_9HYPH|nr:EamA family transporter [Pseudorhodoplanes sinuspersici]ARQ00239.1 hypothetical protein CAK95_15025 [Pseudorhodoplanes sinuspersici]RKE67613.1 hypothetical protein DFP91_5379 [Pseudorhodoplanes sinuspersici]
MPEPIVYAILAMACYGFSDFIYKQAATAGIRADHFLMAQAWVFCPTVIVYALATGTMTFTLAALWGSLAGGLYFVGFYFFIRSLAAGAVSTNATIFRLNFIVTVTLSIAFLGEHLTTTRMAGLVLALTATWLLVGTGSLAGSASSPVQRKSLIQVTVATIAFGTATFFHTVGLRSGAGPEILMVAQAAVFMPLATFIVFHAKGTVRLPAATFKYSLPASIALLCATLFLLRGLALGQASALVPIAQMGFIVAALLGIFVLREAVTVRKAAGLAFALCALAALAAS